MGERGIVHVFRPTWTEPDPERPGHRRRRESSTYNWRFEYRNRKYSGGDGYKTQREAREAGDKRMREVKAGLEEDPHKAGFSVLARIMRAEAELLTKDTSKRSVLDSLSRLEKFFGHDRLMEITRERLIEYVAHRRSLGRRDSTTRLDLGHLRRAMLAAQDKGLVFRVPKAPRLRVEPRRQTVSPHELDAIVSHLPEWWVRYYVVADEIGWRARRELRSRQWSDVDLGSPGWVRLDAEHSKTGQPRVFPMTARLRSVLKAQREWVSAIERETGSVIPWVFCRKDGRPLGDTRKVWSKAVVAAGFGKIEGRTGPWSSARVPHDIRRTVLRRWKTWGEAMDVRKDLAGHESDDTQAWYTDGDLASLQAFAERVDERRKAEAEKVVPISAARKG